MTCQNTTPKNFPSLSFTSEFVERVHGGQRYGDKPYIYHLNWVRGYFTDPVMQTIALLHDVVEDQADTQISQYVVARIWGGNIMSAVMRLTRRGGENYFDYIRRVMDDNSTYYDVERVKLTDIACHLEHRAGLKDTQKKRYQKAFAMLARDMMSKWRPADLVQPEADAVLRWLELHLDDEDSAAFQDMREEWAYPPAVEPWLDAFNAKFNGEAE